MNKFKFLVLFFVCFSFSFASVHIGPGQSYANIEPAFSAGAIQPGDTVFLHAGSYSGYQGIPGLKGTKNGWIVITNFMNDRIDISGCWQFMSCEYIKLSKLIFKANSKYPGRLINVDNGGSVTTQTRHFIIDSCEFSGTTDATSITAVKFGGVDSFAVTHCHLYNFPVCDAFDFNVCHEGIISDNLVENCLTGGHIKGGASNITMERNLFLNASASPYVVFELGGDTGDQFYFPNDSFEVGNLKFYSNIIVGGYRGLALSSARNCKVINNTFYNCGQATLRFLTTSHLFPALADNRVENNIFAFGSSAYINGGTQPANAAYLTKNIYYSLNSSPFSGPYWDSPELDSIREKNPIIAGSDIPMFISPATNDFRLAEKSPAIGAGMSENEPLTDFYGKKFNPDGRSIGAIEYPFPDVVNEKQNPLIRHFQIYPNPAEDYLIISLENSNSLYESLISRFEIVNALGYNVSASIKYIFISQNSLLLDISGLTPGMYFIKTNSQRLCFIKL